MNPPRHCTVCGAHGTVALGIRARDEDSNAVWAPNLGAYLCQEHAEAGCLVEITITPKENGRVTMVTHGPRGQYVTALVIGKGIKVAPGQEALNV